MRGREQHRHLQFKENEARLRENEAEVEDIIPHVSLFI